MNTLKRGRLDETADAVLRMRSALSINDDTHRRTILKDLAETVIALCRAEEGYSATQPLPGVER